MQRGQRHHQKQFRYQRLGFLLFLQGFGAIRLLVQIFLEISVG
jgi:hypothetical protein